MKQTPNSPQSSNCNKVDKKGYNTSIVLGFVGLNSSNYYNNINRKSKNENSSNSNNPNGRPIPGYSKNKSGKKISDKQIKEWLLELV